MTIEQNLNSDDMGSEGVSSRGVALVSTLLAGMLMVACGGSSTDEDTAIDVANSINPAPVESLVENSANVVAESTAENLSESMSAESVTETVTEPEVESEVGSTVTTPSTSTEALPVELPQTESSPLLLGAEQAVERVALLYIAETDSSFGIEVDVTATFHRLTTPLDNPPVLREQTSLDVCEISSAASQLNAQSLAFPIDHILTSDDNQPFQITPTDIGDSIDISSGAGSYAMLLATEAETELAANQYVLQDGSALNALVPDELSVDVSGANIPLAWDWVKPESLELSWRDSLREISSQPSLTWNATEQSDTSQSRIMLYAGAIDELTGAFQSFECSVTDDGEFTMPLDVQALYDNGFAPNFVDIVRYTSHVQSVEDVMVVSVFVQKF